MKHFKSSHGPGFTAQKLDLELVWRNVYYAPSPTKIRETLKENLKLHEANKLQYERNLSMYELFGAGKTLVGNTSKDLNYKNKVTNQLIEEETITETDVVDESQISKSISNKLSKDAVKIKRGMSVTARKVSHVAYKAEKSQVAISNLTLIFQQNKPQTFFGIRKPKTFEGLAEKESKGELMRQNPTAELIFGLFVNVDSESYVKSSITKAQLHQSISCKLSTVELKEKLSYTDKSGQIGEREISSILNKPSVKSYKEKEDILRLSGFSRIRFPDSNDKLKCDRVLSLYANKYYRSNHPKYRELIGYEEETELEHNIIKNCILNNQILSRVMKNHSLYPSKLRQTLAEIDMKLSRHAEDNIGRPSTYTKKSKIDVKMLGGKYGSQKKKSNTLDEISSDCKEFSGFYRPLVEYWCNVVMESDDYLGEIEPHNIKYVVQVLPIILSKDRNIPGSKAISLVQQLIKSGLNNNMLLVELCQNVDGWLDQVLRSLLSKFASIRLEAFITLCYLLSKPSYITALNANVFNDTFYDLTTTILRCMDLRSDEFPLYYSLLGVVVHYAPSQVILDSLMDRAPYSTEIEMVSKWPRFLYLAIRYWPVQNFNSSPIHLRRVVENLESHYLRESLCRKNIKDAICCICKRFNITSDMITIWPKNVEQFPD